MPPIIRVQTQDFDVSAELAALTAGRDDIGGIGSFIGTVRGTVGARRLVDMTLEHYPGMTERAMTRIADQAGNGRVVGGLLFVFRRQRQ